MLKKISNRKQAIIMAWLIVMSTIYWVFIFRLLRYYLCLFNQVYFNEKEIHLYKICCTKAECPIFPSRRTGPIRFLNSHSIPEWLLGKQEEFLPAVAISAALSWNEGTELRSEARKEVSPDNLFISKSHVLQLKRNL